MAKPIVTIKYNNFPKLAQQMPKAANRIVRETLLDIQEMVVQGLTNGPHTGRLYNRGNRTHQASAPGEMPATDQGTLLNSLQIYLAAGATSGEYGTVLETALHLEYGAPRAHIEPRPFLTPAAEAARAGFERKVKRLESYLQ